MKRTVVILMTVILLVSAIRSEAFLGLLFPKYFNEKMIPSKPNPVVFMVKGKSYGELQSKTVNALKSIGYTINRRYVTEDSEDSGEINAKLYVTPPYAHPDPEDYIQGEVLVSIMPEENYYLVSVKGVKFAEYRLGKHKPEFLTAQDAAGIIRQQLLPSVITDGKVPGSDFYIAGTDYKITDIEGITAFCKPDFERSSRIKDVSEKNESDLAICFRQLEVIGGFADQLPRKNIWFLMQKNAWEEIYWKDSGRRYRSYIKYYGFNGGDEKLTNEVYPKKGYPETEVEIIGESMMIIKTKDGKNLTIPGMREDIFRKRLW